MFQSYKPGTLGCIRTSQTFAVLFILAVSTWTTFGANAGRPRSLITRNRSFVDSRTGAVVLLGGADVVMKGPPWIPSTNGCVCACVCVLVCRPG